MSTKWLELIYDSFHVASIFSGLLTMILSSVILVKKRYEKPYITIICMAMVLSFVTDIVLWYVAEQNISNHHIIQIYNLCEISLIVLFHFVTIKKQYLKVLTLTIYVLFLYVALGVESWSVFPSYSRTIGSILIGVLSLNKLICYANNIRFVDIIRNISFLMNSAIFVYFIGNIVFVYVLNTVSSNPEQFSKEFIKLLLLYNFFIHIIYQLIMGLALWKILKQQKSLL